MLSSRLCSAKTEPRARSLLPELDLLNRYATSYKAFLTTQIKARLDAGATTIDDILNIDSVAVEQFQQQDWVQQRNALLVRKDIAKVLQEEAPFFEIYKILQLFDKTGTDPVLKDIALAHHFYSQIDQTRKQARLLRATSASARSPCYGEYRQRQVCRP